MERSESNRELLKKYWGYDSFRSRQEEIILSVEEGRDTLALMPTGGGKSVCFQIPALAAEGICIVVSPLIALIKDQVRNLRQRGIPALAVHSGMSRRAIDIALDNAVYGSCKFLYVSPERLGTTLFKVRLSKMKVNYLVVDEAHCISQWGYDFRPAYLKIRDIKSIIGDVPTVALTATATSEVAEDIMLQLGFRERNIIAADFSRSNLAYLVRETEDKLGTLLRVCTSAGGKFEGPGKGVSGIVYCRERKKCAEIADFLNNSGFSADYYHAGLGKETRDRKQESWMGGGTDIIVATNAFGMGIDKADVRFIVHYDVPDSIEAYFQEAGRAGRDGGYSWAVLLWNDTDIRRLRQIHAMTFPSPEYLAKVYQAVFRHLQIAYGEGAESVRKFSLPDFATGEGLNAVNAYYAMKYLEQDGYWELTDEIDNPSRLMFTVERDDLYNVQLKEPVLDALIKSVLRIYPGLFSGLVRIDEEYIARATVDTVENVVAKLKELAHMKIVRYIPRVRTPLLFIKYERLAENNFCIDSKRYEVRKEQLGKRLDAIIGYVRQSASCRSRFLIDYFSQPAQDNCGICDICIRKGQRGNSDSLRAEIAREILSLVKAGSMQLADVQVLAGPGREDIYLSVLREMIDRGLLGLDGTAVSLPERG